MTSRHKDNDPAVELLAARARQIIREIQIVDDSIEEAKMKVATRTVERANLKAEQAIIQLSIQKLRTLL